MGILKDKERMCKACESCEDCPIRKASDDAGCYDFAIKHEDEAIKLINEWVENHPEPLCDNCVHNQVCKWSDSNPDGCSYYSKPHVKIQFEGKELSISEVTNMLTNMRHIIKHLEERRYQLNQELKQLKEYYHIGED